MIRLFFATFFSLLLGGTTLSAQFGLSGKYLNPLANWTLAEGVSDSQTADLYASGWSAGIDYWFRLKNVRVEFLPELNYGQLDNQLPDGALTEAKLYSFFLNTNFYLWDFRGDCDCPTFSKQGPTLQKGLFVQLSPGVTYWQHQYEYSGSVFEQKDWAINIGAGLGFDLGLSDLITLTPMINLRYYLPQSLENLSELIRQDDNAWQLGEPTADPLMFSAGLRLGIRLDDQ